MANDLLNNMEASIKREITRIYKGSFGKGPEETRIRVMENVVMMRFDGALTDIETSLLDTEEGFQLVADMRKRMVHQKKADYIPMIEEIVGQKVQSITYDFSAVKNQMYVFIIFTDDVIDEDQIF